MSIRNRPHGLIRKRRRKRKSLDVIILTSDFPLDTQLATLLGSKLKESRWNKEKRTHKLTRMRCSVSTKYCVAYGWKYVHVENMLPLTPSVRHPGSIASDNMCMLRMFEDESHLSGTMACLSVQNTLTHKPCPTTFLLPRDQLPVALTVSVAAYANRRLSCHEYCCLRESRFNVL